MISIVMDEKINAKTYPMGNQYIISAVVSFPIHNTMLYCLKKYFSLFQPRNHINVMTANHKPLQNPNDQADLNIIVISLSSNINPPHQLSSTTTTSCYLLSSFP
mmetsp:Transcript_9839/g.19651  ORF Transcript_9839/g.19651 Transcript_9839/m.19651 type:complete len:104 (+) Transcript_9839:28-339(+)